jgi:hypothetical protein
MMTGNGQKKVMQIKENPRLKKEQREDSLHQIISGLIGLIHVVRLLDIQGRGCFAILSVCETDNDKGDSVRSPRCYVNI